jgi:hypothetical protein
VASQLSFNPWGGCAYTKLQQLGQDSNLSQCGETYTINQVSTLQTVAEDAFGFQCFGDMLMSVCGTYVNQTYLEPIRASLATTTTG